MPRIFAPEDRQSMREAVDALSLAALSFEVPESLTRSVSAGYCPDCRMPVTISGVHLCHSGLHFEF